MAELQPEQGMAIHLNWLTGKSAERAMISLEELHRSMAQVGKFV